MKLVVENGLNAGWMIHSFGRGSLSACVLLKGTYRLIPGATAVQADEPLPLSGDRYRDDDASRSLVYASDLVPWKPRADVLVVGTAHAPGGRAVQGLLVRMQIGRLVKELRVLGRRSWQKDRISTTPPEPFVTLPIDYEWAFGGRDWGKNPVGLGRRGDELPRIEDPRRPITGPGDDINPAGLGPISGTWAQRVELARRSVYDEAWRRRRWPWVPEDFDYGYYNAAPDDQQLSGYVRGDEEFCFDNLHPIHSVFAGRLPGLRVRCVLDESRPSQEPCLREVPLVLDTLWFHLDTELLIMQWRGSATVLGPKLTEVESLMAWTEPLAGPMKSATEYRDLLQAQATEERAELEPVPVKPESDAAFEAEFAAMDHEFAEAEQQFVTHEQEAEGLMAQEKQAALARGMTLEQWNAAYATQNTLTDWETFVATHPELTPTETGPLKADFAEAQRFEGEVAGMDEEFATTFPVSLTRDDVLAAAAERTSLAEANLSRLELSGVDFAGLNMRGANLGKAVLAGAVLAGASLQGADLSGSNLAGADLTGANLDGADLTRANLTGAKLTGLSLAGATLRGLRLAGADLSDVSGDLADFSECDLTNARFRGARLTRADFTGAKLDNADLSGATLVRAALDGVSAIDATLEGADITGASLSEKSDFTRARFRGARGPGAIFSTSVMDRADFAGASLPGAQFSETALRQADLDRADLSRAMFDDALLTHAKLTNANLLRANFERAHLVGADFSGSNLYEAGFWESVVQETNLTSANLKGTLLA